MESPLSSHLFVAKVTNYGFGVDPERTADALRRLADALDTKDVLLQKVTVYSQVCADEFPGCGLVLRLVEKLPIADRGDHSGGA